MIHLQLDSEVNRQLKRRPTSARFGQVASLGQVSEVLGDDQLGLELGVRATGLAEKLPKFAPRQPSLALCDVAWDGNSRSPDLRCQTLQLLSGEALRQAIDVRDQSNRLLPNQEITIVLSHSISSL